MFASYRIIVLLFSCLTVGVTSPALAMEKLDFSSRIDVIARLNISTYIKDKIGGTLDEYDASMTDLNGDNLYEYILREKKCLKSIDSGNFCRFLIIAENKDKIVLLTDLNAREIAISDTKTHGVNDILAFQNKKNDYDYWRYLWSPEDMTYVPEKEQ